MDGHARDFDDLVAVQVEQRVDEVVRVLACCLVIVEEERSVGARHAGDVVGDDETLGPERLGVAHQQLHRLLFRLAFATIEHGAFAVREFHVAARIA